MLALEFAPTGATEQCIEASRRLRTETHIKMCRSLVARIIQDPTPTEAESRMGAYVECLEPQVRAAVMRLRQRGYSTRSSGFSDLVGGQYIQFDPAPISDTAKEQIVQAGGSLIEREDGVAGVSFDAPAADLDTITARWDTLSELMPDRGSPAPAQDRRFTDTAFVINAVCIGLRPEELMGSPFATEIAMIEGLPYGGYTTAALT